MSRIQNILAKAERDGYTRRVRGQEALASSGGALGSSVSLKADDEREADEFGQRTAYPLAAANRVVLEALLDPSLVTATSTDLIATEQYRSLRTRVLQADAASPVRVLIVTSPGRGEGKTLTAANLSLAMAQEKNRRICLVDADLRKPSLQQLFGLPDGPGLCDVLSGSASVSDALVLLEEHQLTILPAGHVPAHPAELLATSAMRRTVDTLRAEFDRVVIDAPSVAPLADVGMLTPFVDALLLVVRAGVTSKPAIRDAIASLDRSKLLGLVLNES